MKTAGSKNRIRLTELGTQKLQSWLDANGRRQVELGEHMGLPHQTAIHRALNREGLLTPEQIALAVAFCGGDLTAADLVDATEVERIPVLPPVERAKPAAVAAPSVPADMTREQAEKLFADMASTRTPAALAVLEQLMESAKSETLRARCAEVIIEHGRGKPRQYQETERIEAPLQDEELIERLTRLVEQAEKAQGAA